MATAQVEPGGRVQILGEGGEVFGDDGNAYRSMNKRRFRVEGGWLINQHTYNSTMC